MGQHANTNRHSSLDDKKLRAAGRIKERAKAEIRQALEDTMPQKQPMNAPPREKRE